MLLHVDRALPPNRSRMKDLVGVVMIKHSSQKMHLLLALEGAFVLFFLS